MSPWKRLIPLALATSVAGAVVASSVNAQPATGPPCAPHAEMAEKLGRHYGERVSGLGLAANGVLVELFVAESGSWTLVYTAPNGRSCIAMAGEGWEAAGRTLTRAAGIAR